MTVSYLIFSPSKSFVELVFTVGDDVIRWLKTVMPVFNIVHLPWSMICSVVGAADGCVTPDAVMLLLGGL